MPLRRIDNYISYEKLNELLEYDPETGLLRWKIKRSGTCKTGWFAGTIFNGKHEYKYLTIEIKGRTYMVSNVIYCLETGRWPLHEIDHINRDGLNNKWNNLREATPLQNRFNINVLSNNKLGVKGVCRSGKKYKAQQAINGKVVYLGSYDTIEEASFVYEETAKRLHGDFYYKKDD